MRRKVFWLMLCICVVVGPALSFSLAKPLTSDVFIDHEKCTGCGACAGFASGCVEVNDDGKACFVHDGCGFINSISNCQNANCWDGETTEHFVAVCPENAIIR